ncbi:MAG: thiamine pyrophosphate-dependent dehydrogenase E1 component subunit alpha [Acidimicrobiia bacterium]|nr:thiamine pyrophosphate-dependent dehydrogenase E1 component subunit alpha [Acidimicrobiia bacterium]
MEALTAERRIEGFAWMTLTRAFDDAMVAMWKQGRGLGGAFSQRGHEAISVAAGMALGPDDVAAPMHRDLGTYLVRGMTPDRIFGNLLGRETGPSRGRDANLHGLGDLSLGIIGFVSHIPQALPTTLGAAMAFKLRKEPRVALTTVGDGGFTSGATHEVLNMASLYRAPFVLIVENNKYAYSTPLEQQMRSSDFVAKAAAHDVPGVKVDGNDFDAMYAAVETAVDRARHGGGPTVIEADTMRMLGHAIHDGAEYVPAELLEEWKRRDPVDAMRRRLLEQNVATDEQLAAIETTARAKVAEAIATAENAPLPDPATLTDGVYA